MKYFSPDRKKTALCSELGTGKSISVTLSGVSELLQSSPRLFIQRLPNAVEFSASQNPLVWKRPLRPSNLGRLTIKFRLDFIRPWGFGLCPAKCTQELAAVQVPCSGPHSEGLLRSCMANTGQPHLLYSWHFYWSLTTTWRGPPSPGLWDSTSACNAVVLLQYLLLRNPSNSYCTRGSTPYELLLQKPSEAVKAINKPVTRVVLSSATVAGKQEGQQTELF